MNYKFLAVLFLKNIKHQKNELFRFICKSKH